MNPDTFVNCDARQNAAMETNGATTMKYEVREHKNGYVVAAVGREIGISTHASILDAIHMCRVANRYSRELVA